MLTPATPYPQPGSYCLFEDPDDSTSGRTLQLARIIRWQQLSGAALPGDECLVSLPLRDGAGGNRTVRRDQLLDATPLTRDEQRELTDLDRQTRGRECRSPRLKAAKERQEMLKQRLIWSGCLQRKLDRLNDMQRRKAA